MKNIPIPPLPAPGSIDVLFATYGGGHIRMVLPVAKALQDMGYSICLFALTTAIKPTVESGLPWFSYASLPEASTPEIQTLGHKLAAGFSKDGPVPFAETVAYLGLNYRDMENKYGVEEAARKYEQDGRYQFLPIQIIKSLLADLQPRAVVATNSPRSEMAAISAAGLLGIPSLCMVDMFAIQEQAWIKDPGYATKVCVLNTEVRKMLVGKGRPAEDICVTGNPAFDEILNPETIAAGHALRSARGWGKDGRITVLYASAPEPLTDPYTGLPADLDLPLKVEKKMLDIVAGDPKLELIIRRHPSEPQDVPSRPNVHQSTMADDIDVLLYAVDIVVVTCSTVGFQAYLAGRPVVSVECSAVSKDVPYGEFGISCAANSIAELPNALEKALETLNIVDTNISRQKALATTQVAEHIERILQPEMVEKG